MNTKKLNEEIEKILNIVTNESLSKEEIINYRKIMSSIDDNCTQLFVVSINYGPIHAFLSHNDREEYLKQNASYRDSLWETTFYVDKNKQQMKQFFDNHETIYVVRVDDYPVRRLFDWYGDAVSWQRQMPYNSSAGIDKIRCGD